MSFQDVYKNQVALLLEVLPVLNEFNCFALKGGTAINLFVHDMPRLSVDIDLTYLPVENRDVFLPNIETELLKMKQLIEGLGLTVKTVLMKNGTLSKLQVYANHAMIKIEPNFVLRGAVFPCEEKELCDKAQDEFLKFMRVKTLSVADLYGGKICAALDRYHPRDLFDIKLLLENERMFLMHLKSGTPDWSLLPIDDIERLPGIQWKLQNINKIPKDKKNEQLKKLKQVLEV